MKIRKIVVLLIIGLLAFSGFFISAQAQMPKSPADKKAVDRPPRILSLAINSGAANAPAEGVILNNSVEGQVTHYRASLRPDFQGASWNLYSPAPVFTVGGGSGSKTIYLQVKGMGGESNVVSDTINYSPVVSKVPEKKEPIGAPHQGQSEKLLPPGRNLPPHLLSLKINNGAETTMYTGVTLNNRADGEPTHFRASEMQDFSDLEGRTWKPYNEAPSFNFRTGVGAGRHGQKKVYLQVKRAQRGEDLLSNILEDTILYVPYGSSDPRIENLNLSINQVRGTYQLELSYEIIVNDVPGGERLFIDLQAIPITVRSGGEALASKTIGYETGTQSGSQIRHAGILTVNIPLDQATVVSTPEGQAGVPLHQGINIVATIKLPQGFGDTSLSNNTKSKNIFWRTQTIKTEKYIQECRDGGGHKGDWTFDLGSRAANSWIGTNQLILYNCSSVPRSDNTVGCYRNPLALLLGECGGRWEKRPNTADKSGRIHWWCEAGTNEQLHFEVLTKSYEPYVQP